MAQQLKVLASKPQDLSSILVQGENRVPGVVL